MVMNGFSLTRRQTLAGLTASTVLTLGGCAANGSLPRLRPMGNDPDEWLNDVSYRLLEHEPDRATALGVDTGEFAYLRGKLEDQSISGQREYAATLRWVVDQMTGLDESGLTDDQATSFEVVRSAFSTAAEGFDLPYGDVAVGSWRNAPYVVIQNVGTYLDMPRFLDSSQPLGVLPRRFRDVRVMVGGAHDDTDAICYGDSGYGDGLVQIPGTVIDARQDVVVYIDHTRGRRCWGPKVKV